MALPRTINGYLQIGIASPVERTEVNEFVKSHPDGHIEHTWEGAQLLSVASASSWNCRICTLRVQGILSGVMPVSILRPSRLRPSICRSSAGPLVAHEALGYYSLLEEMVRWLAEYGRHAGCCRVELRMPQPFSINEEPDEIGMHTLDILENAGFARLPPPHYGTYWVPLGSEDDMLKGLGKKCRRDVRKGLREGIEIRIGTSTEDMELFRKAYVEMCKRKSLIPRARNYFEDGVKSCLDARLAAIFVSSHKGEICNMALVTLTGRPTYWLGATTLKAMDVKTPPTGQALHFGIMRHLSSMGRKTYDLGGSPGRVPLKNHPNYGVWQFKSEFNGRWIVYLDQFQQTLSPLGNKLLAWAEKARKAVRG